MSEIIPTDMEAFLNARLSFSESPKYNVSISSLSLGFNKIKCHTFIALNPPPRDVHEVDQVLLPGDV